MNRKAALAALCFALLGLTASALATYTHYRMVHDPLYVSFCDVSANVSCTQVLSSRFATVRGVPVAIFGAIWFATAALFAWVGLAARPPASESASGYLFAGSTLALAVVLYLGYASFAILRTACPLCLLTYGAVIGLFFVSGATTTYSMMSLPRRALDDFKVFVASPLALVLAVALAGASVSAVAIFPRETVPGAAPTPEQLQNQQSEIERFMATEPRVPLIIPTQGAKVLIVKFNDFQCPACGQSYQMYKPVLAKYEASNPGAVRVVLRDFPLNPSCNDTVRVVIHTAACEAAVAVRLARARGREEAMEEWLYTHQEGMTPDTVKAAAREVGLVTDFATKFTPTLEQVKADVNLGRQLKVSSTPTFYINGVKFNGAIAPQFFDQAIAYELKQAETK